MKIIIRDTWNRSGYSVWLMKRFQDGDRLVQPVEFKFGESLGIDEVFQLPEPTMYIQRGDFDG